MSLVCVLILPVILWVAFCLLLRNQAYAFDQGDHKGSFFAFLITYQVLGYVVFATGIGTVLYCFDHSLIWPALVTLVGVGEALLFNVVIAFFYESYLHYRAIFTNSNYTRMKYALVLSVGISALVTFAVGLIMAATGMVAEKVL